MTVAEYAPDVVVNAAAYTAVDAAEIGRGTPPTRSTRAGRPSSPARWPGTAVGWYTSRPTMSSPATPSARTRSTTRPSPDRPTAAPSSPASRPSESSCRRPSYVVRTAWVYGAAGRQLRQDDGGLGATSAIPSASSTTSAAPRPGRRISPAALVELARSDAARRHLPLHRQSGDTTWFGLTREPSSSSSAPTRLGSCRRRPTPSRDRRRGRPTRCSRHAAWLARRPHARCRTGATRCAPRSSQMGGRYVANDGCQRHRIAVVTADVLGRQMAGPAIRALHIAEALAPQHDVTLVSTARCTIDARGVHLSLCAVGRVAGGDRRGRSSDLPGIRLLPRAVADAR